MAKTPNFDEIAKSITQADIDKFLRTAGPEDFREQVLAATDQSTKARFVAGYLIRTKQIGPDRLAQPDKKGKTAGVTAAKPRVTRKRAATPATTQV